MKKTMRNKEIKEILDIVSVYGFSKKDKYEIDDAILLINGKASFFYYKTQLIPILKLLLQKNTLKTITVDMGAVKFVCKGADIMRPGITECEDFPAGEVVAIIDENHHKSSGVGEALLSSEELIATDKGKVVKNLHYVGDEIWNY